MARLAETSGFVHDVQLRRNFILAACSLKPEDSLLAVKLALLFDLAAVGPSEVLLCRMGKLLGSNILTHSLPWPAAQLFVELSFNEQLTSYLWSS